MSCSSGMRYPPTPPLSSRSKTLPQTFLDRLGGYFENLAIETFCHKNRLQVEIGAAFPTRGCNACTAIQEALETSKKYV